MNNNVEYVSSAITQDTLSAIMRNFRVIIVFINLKYKILFTSKFRSYLFQENITISYSEMLFITAILCVVMHNLFLFLNKYII